MLDALVQRFAGGDRLALSRLITHLARGEHREEILSATSPPRKHARVVAVTGSAGVGKLIEVLRKRALTVAVLACDPQSPLSGGALLGDRFRMPTLPDDAGVFIRSLAAPGGRGAVAEQTGAILRLLEAFGFDLIFLETVGAGQGDTAVRDLADVVVLLLQPETGDDLQWEKAGVLEVADIVAVHKSDMPGAEHVEAQVRGALGLSSAPAVLVLRVSARTGAGVEELTDAILAASLRRQDDSADGRDLLLLAKDVLGARFEVLRSRPNGEWKHLLERWSGGRVSAEQAVSELLRLLQDERRHAP